MYTTPLTITRDNALTVTGLSWREVLRLARKHGIPVFAISRSRTAVDGARLLAALHRERAELQAVTDDPPPRPADDVDKLLIELGILR